VNLAMTERRRKLVFANVPVVGGLLLVIGLLYVLSYAPVVRWTRNPSPLVASDGSRFPVYKPLDWLIDNTPARNLLFRWADLWGVGDIFRFNHRWRPTRIPESP